MQRACSGIGLSQLGIGNQVTRGLAMDIWTVDSGLREDTLPHVQAFSTPSVVAALADEKVASIAGGQHHTLAVTEVRPRP